MMLPYSERLIDPNAVLPSVTMVLRKDQPVSVSSGCILHHQTGKYAVERCDSTIVITEETTSKTADYTYDYTFSFSSGPLQNGVIYEIYFDLMTQFSIESSLR